MCFYDAPNPPVEKAACLIKVNMLGAHFSTCRYVAPCLERRDQQCVHLLVVVVASAKWDTVWRPNLDLRHTNKEPKDKKKKSKTVDCWTISVAYSRIQKLKLSLFIHGSGMLLTSQ